MAKKPLKGFPKSDAQKMLDRLSAPKKFAQGGLSYLPVTQIPTLRSSDKAWLDQTKQEQDKFNAEREAFNKALDEYNANVYNPYKSAFDQYKATVERGINQDDYYNKYTDVRDAGQNAFQHYIDYGYGEGREMPGFDPKYYLEANPDVAAAGVNPFQHYLEHGAAEGRMPIRAPDAPVAFGKTAPTVPALTQEEFDARVAAARERAQQDAGARAVAIKAANAPDEFNLAGFGFAGKYGTSLFKDGGEVEQESTASRMLKEVVPLDTRTFVSTLFGNRDPITEKNLNADQLSALREVVQTAEQKGRKGNVQYSDYEKFNAGPQHNAHISLSTTLGRFNYVQNPDGSLTVVDRYDFANPGREEAIKAYEGMGPARKALEVAKRTAQRPLAFPLSLASELGNAYIGREGRDVKIQVPPSESKKMLDGVKKPPKK
jgi:hypothetical protein